jgi:hypothetical protein
MADAGICNIESDIMRSNFTTVKLEWNKWLASFHDGI